MKTVFYPFASLCEVQNRSQIVKKESNFESKLANARKGDSEEMIRVGICYYNGRDNCVKDIEQAKYWFNKAIESNNADGYAWLAFIYEEERDNSNFIECLRKGVANNNGTCYSLLFSAYKNGEYGLAKNKYIAGELLLKSAELKITNLFSALGYAYMDGNFPNIPKNSQKAIFWFKKYMDSYYMDYGKVNENVLRLLSDLGCKGYEPALYHDEYLAWLKEKNKSLSSTKPSNSSNSYASTSSTTSNGDNLTYHYTKSGRGQSQNTGQWTDAIGSEECVVQFTDDGISVNGMYQPYVKTSGAWKVYGGTSMGVGGSNTTFYYYVDGNKNMKQVCESSSPYGFDTFVYPMSRNGDPTPMGNNVNNGGYVNSNGTNNNTGTGSGKQPARQFKCAYCNGSGRIERNDNAPASFGQTRANKKCNECGKIYDPTVFNHYHVQCGHCGGTGNAK